jgi:glycine/D-amino acid oxidase-like deaminating enzyme/nitrite reductase/ring-hydroxylating ferredoxin subunit
MEQENDSPADKYRKSNKSPAGTNFLCVRQVKAFFRSVLKLTGMNTQSVWKVSDEKRSFPSLETNISVDVAIVGGGITGITTAYLLSKAGKKVVVLEAREIANGATGYSTGNLYAMVGGKGLHSLKSKWDEDVMKQVVASRAAAVDFIGERVNEFAIDCDFKRVSWCLFSNNEEQESYVQKEQEAANTAGLKTAVDIPFPLHWKFGFSVPNQAQFNPYMYVVGLAESINSGNCSIYEHTKVTNVEEGDVCTLTTTGGTVTAAQVVMATHTPKGIYKVQTSLGPYRECAVAVKLNGTYPPPGTFWYMLEDEHYSLRTYETPDSPVLMVLGETYKVGHGENTEEKFQKLEAFLREHFDVASVDYKWAAQQYKPADGLPYIGLSSGNEKTYIATGFAADGLTWGTLAAMIITDQIMGVENPWSETFKGARNTPLASAGEFIKENVDVLVQYLKDIPGNVEAKDVNEIIAGEGKIIQAGGEKIAAYRDHHNGLHLCSAVCTHMDCIVAFNEAERSWDCPCHGSRFTIDGEVIEGPAITDLPKRGLKND